MWCVFALVAGTDCRWHVTTLCVFTPLSYSWCARIIHKRETWYFSKRVKSSTINLWHAVNTKMGANIRFYHHRKSSEEISCTFVLLLESCFQFWICFTFNWANSASFISFLNTWHPVLRLPLRFLNLFLRGTILGLFLSQATSFCTQCLILN